jgi:hypothetical protein
MNQLEQGLQPSIQTLRYIHPTLPHSLIGFEHNILSIFFNTFVVICLASAPAVAIASAFELHFKWRLICGSMTTLCLLYGVSRVSGHC